MKLHYPATARNRAPILTVLEELLPASAMVLEVASGSGEHGVHFAAAHPDWMWLPSDVSDECLASIEAHRQASEIDNLAPARRLDVSAPPWDAPDVDAVFAANMIHISPWRCTEGLFAGAAQVLRAGGQLVIYGPFRFAGRYTAPSNEAFDASLKARNPAWGVRDTDDLGALAKTHGLEVARTIAMPANNHVLTFRKPEA